MLNPIRKIKTINASLKNNVIITFITIVGIVIGFLSQMVIASYFGATKYMDAYLAASVVPSYLTSVLIGSLGFVFIPVFIDNIAKDRHHEAWLIASTFANLLLIILSFLSIFGLIFADSIISLTAPGLSLETHQIAVRIFRILWPSIITIGITTLSISIYQSFSRFIWSSAVPALGALFTLILILLLVKKFGINGLAIATLGGLIIQTLLLLPIFFKPGNYRSVLKLMNPGFRQIIQLYLPLFAVSIFSKSTTLAERYFASELPGGSISHLSYAFKILTVAIVVISTSISTTVFPKLATQLASNDIGQFRNTISKSFIFMWMALVPAVIMGMILSFPFIVTVFQRGQFNVGDSEAVTVLLQILLLSVPAACLGGITGKIFYVQKKTKTLAVFGIFESVSYLIYTYYLSKYFGVIGIAIGYVIYFNLSNLWQMLYLRFTKTITNLNIINSFFKIFFAAGLGGLFTLFIIKLIDKPFYQLIIGALSGSSIYIIMLYLFKVKELNFRSVKIRHTDL